MVLIIANPEFKLRVCNNETTGKRVGMGDVIDLNRNGSNNRGIRLAYNGRGYIIQNKLASVASNNP